METLRRLRNDYDTDKRIKLTVLAVALVLTIANLYTVDFPQILVVTLVPTILLYYISDGIMFFIGLTAMITKAIFKIAGVFFSILGFFAVIGYVVCFIFIVASVPMTILVCLCFAYVFPIAFVPLFHFGAKKLGMSWKDLKADVGNN